MQERRRSFWAVVRVVRSLCFDVRTEFEVVYSQLITRFRRAVLRLKDAPTCSHFHRIPHLPGFQWLSGPADGSNFYDNIRSHYLDVYRSLFDHVDKYDDDNDSPDATIIDLEAAREHRRRMGNGPVGS